MNVRSLWPSGNSRTKNGTSGATLVIGQRCEQLITDTQGRRLEKLATGELVGDDSILWANLQAVSAVLGLPLPWSRGQKQMARDLAYRPDAQVGELVLELKATGRKLYRSIRQLATYSVLGEQPGMLIIACPERLGCWAAYEPSEAMLQVAEDRIAWAHGCRGSEPYTKERMIELKDAGWSWLELAVYFWMPDTTMQYHYRNQDR